MQQISKFTAELNFRVKCPIKAQLHFQNKNKSTTEVHYKEKNTGMFS